MHAVNLYIVNIFLMVVVFFTATIIVAEAFEYTSVIEQRNPTSLSDARNRQSYLIRGLQGQVSLKTNPKSVFNAFRMEGYPSLTNEQIIARLSSARPVAVYWRAGEVGPYAFHKTIPNRAKIIYRASHGKEWVLVDSQSGKAVVSLYCGNPLKDSRVTRMAEKAVRIPDYRPTYRSAPVVRSRELVEVRRRDLVEVRQRPQISYPQAQRHYASGGSIQQDIFGGGFGSFGGFGLGSILPFLGGAVAGNYFGGQAMGGSIITTPAAVGVIGGPVGGAPVNPPAGPINPLP